MEQSTTLPWRQQQFRAFWSGPPLSVYEELSLASFVARGQQVIVYSYDRSLRVPQGVELADANEIMPGGRIYEFVHPWGERTPALHSDLFRYELLRRLGDWYFDLDVVLLRDSPPECSIYLGREDEAIINGAVMRLPPGSDIMIAATDRARNILDNAKWGGIGPAFITSLAQEFGLAKLACAWPIVFPIRPAEVPLLFLPEHRDELVERVAAADFVHFWHEIWRQVRIPKMYGPPEGSFLDSLFRRFDIRISPEARLPADAVRSWFREFGILQEMRYRSTDAKSWLRDLEALQCIRARYSDVDPLDILRERDELLASTSWHLTAPLRFCMNAYRRAYAALKHAAQGKFASASRSASQRQSGQMHHHIN